MGGGEELQEWPNCDLYESSTSEVRRSTHEGYVPIMGYLESQRARLIHDSHPRMQSLIRSCHSIFR